MAWLLEDRMRDFTRYAVLLAGAIAVLGAVVIAAVKLGDYRLEQERLSQQRCLDRGGKITMYAGGFTSWACEGMTKL